MKVKGMAFLDKFAEADRVRAEEFKKSSSIAANDHNKNSI
jgi:hypothetical protein